jgi:hypothetical protein
MTTIAAIVVQSACQMGNLGVKTAIEAIQGRKVPVYPR